MLALTPLVARFAHRIGALDVPPTALGCTTRPVPRIGGIAIVAGILVPAAVFVDPDGPYLGILVGTLRVAALGLVDDIRGLRPRRSCWESAWSR